MERPDNCQDLYDFISYHGVLDEKISKCLFNQVNNNNLVFSKVCY